MPGTRKRKKVGSSQSMPPSAASVAAKIGVAVEDWKGNCYGIACLLVDKGVVRGTPRYGHYRGWIDPDGYFKHRAGLGFCRHGWVEVEDGEVVDPTRWVFESASPYIYWGANGGLYDIGGSQFRKSLRAGREVPKFDAPPPPGWPKRPPILVPASGEALHFLRQTFPDGRDAEGGLLLDFGQVIWAGNTPSDEWPSFAAGRQVCQALIEAGCPEAIPIDERRRLGLAQRRPTEA